MLFSSTNSFQANWPQIKFLTGGGEVEDGIDESQDEESGQAVLNTAEQIPSGLFMAG